MQGTKWDGSNHVFRYLFWTRFTVSNSISLVYFITLPCRLTSTCTRHQPCIRMPNATADTKYKKRNQNLRISWHIIRTIWHDGIYGYNAIILERWIYGNFCWYDDLFTKVLVIIHIKLYTFSIKQKDQTNRHPKIYSFLLVVLVLCLFSHCCVA